MDIFTKIINNKTNDKIIFQNDFVTVFHDINPRAPIHLLIVPNIKIKNCNEINNFNILYISHIFLLLKVVKMMVK